MSDSRERFERWTWFPGKETGYWGCWQAAERQALERAYKAVFHASTLEIATTAIRALMEQDK